MYISNILTLRTLPCLCSEHLAVALKLGISSISGLRGSNNMSALLLGELAVAAQDGQFEWKQIEVRAPPGQYLLSLSAADADSKVYLQSNKVG